MNAEKAHTWVSVELAARRTEFGCHATERTVERSCFLVCFETHHVDTYPLLRRSRDHVRSRSDSNLFLVGRPATCVAVGTDESKSGLPTGRRRLPDEGITICEVSGCGLKTIASHTRAPRTLGARDDLVRLRCDIRIGNGLVMPGKAHPPTRSPFRSKRAVALANRELRRGESDRH